MLIFSEDPENSVSLLGRLTFDQFDMTKVLSNSSHLMGSEGKEYDLEEDTAPGIDLKERMAKQRQILNARLGLDMASKFGVDIGDIYSNDDLVQSTTSVSETTVEEAARVNIFQIMYLL